MNALRSLKLDINKSYFLFGPRGTGKTTFLRFHFKESLFLNLLDKNVYFDLLKDPQRLVAIVGEVRHVVIDELQKIPELLDVVHLLMEEKKVRFILTGSSARKLKKSNVNMLAGRAINAKMFPLTIHELGDRFDFAKAVSEGMLPTLYDDEKNVTAKEYLDSYVDTYLREEVQAEGLTKNLVGFLKFLEVASFSHAEVVNYSNIAREAGISRKMVENYFSILEDLLIASFLPVFSKMAKRKLITHNKFYFFDAGVYQQLRPKGLLDRATNIYGAAVEGFVLQEMKAYNMYYKLDLQIYFWRSANDHEVDFVVYGQNKIIAIEVKGAKNIDRSDFKSLLEFKKDYEEAQLYYLYSGDRVETYGNINVVPIVDFLKNFQQIVS